ncbi:MAG: hypothetical protein ABJO27_17645 [Pseudoruegeria sp.]
MKNTPSKTLRSAALMIALAIAGASGGTAQAGTASICKVTPKDAFFEIFKCGSVVEIAWTESYTTLRGYSKAEVLAYISGLINGVHSETAPFHVAPQLLIARDPKLPFRLSMMAMSNPEILNDTVNDGLQIFKDVLGDWVQERQRQTDAGVIDPLGEWSAVGRGMASAGNAKILWAGKIGSHDFHTLAALSHTDPDTAVQVYQALADLAGKL